MHTIPALRLLPQHVPGRSLKALAVLVLHYAVIAPLAFGTWTPAPLRPLAQALLAVQILVAPAGLLLRHFSDLMRTATVLRAQCAPSTLWRSFLRQWLAVVTGQWLLATACMTLIAAEIGGQPWWPALPAIVSLAYCLCACGPLGKAGMLAPAYGRIAAIVLPVLVAAFALYLQAVLAWVAALPAAVLAAATLAWPAMACWLLQARSGEAPTVLATPAFLVRFLASAPGSWLARHTFLRDETGHPVNRLSSMHYFLVAFLLVLASQMLLLPLLWGTARTAGIAGRMLIVCALLTFTLQCRDLHWRRLLAPHGVQQGQGRLGLHILVSGLPLQVFCFGMITLSQVFSALLLGQGGSAALGQLAASATLVPELALCLAVAILLRALPATWLTAARIALTSIPAGIFLLHVFHPQLAALRWAAGYPYTAALLAATCMALVAANRLWTPARLLSSLERNHA